MPTARNALDYTAVGMAVLPVYMPKDGGCSCPAGKDCTSPGKHPQTALIAHGIHDATLIPNRVRELFTDEQNIGLACGTISGGLMVFDVDDSETAQYLLALKEIRKQTAVSLTRRGCHIYMYTTGDTHTIHLRATDGRKLGELRGDGAYVVAPPSHRVDGDRYRWLQKEDALSHIIHLETQSAIDFVIGLLAKAGVDVASPNNSSIIDIPLTPIEAAPLPFKTSKAESRLRQLMTGTMPVNDRSGALVELAHHALISAERHNYNLSSRELAGFLKYVDAIQWRKYADRDDHESTFRYMEIAVRYTRNSHIYQQEAQASGDSDEDEDDEELPPYMWIDHKGLFKTAAKGNRLICNFRPDLIEERIAYNDDDEVVRQFLLGFERLDDTQERILFDADDLADTRRFLRQVINRGGADFQVEPGMGTFIWHAAQKLAYANGPPLRTIIPSHTGWTSDGGGQDGFVLPYESRGIVVSSAPQVEFRQYTAPQALMNYGRHVRPIVSGDDADAALTAFRSLLKTAKPEVSIPVLLHIMAGPVVAQDAPEAPCLVHIAGLTGTFKTAYATACLSLFGQFDRSTIPGAWNWTANALGRLMHDACDLTTLVDDFKSSRLRGGKKSEIMEFIHSYSDRSPRGRLNTRQQQQHLLKPRALMLSTGEDVPDWEQSMLARMIVVNVQPGSVDKEQLTQLQEHASAGDLGLIGGTWLSWLAFTGITYVRTEANDLRLRARDSLQEQTHHPRMSDNLASLFAIGGLVRRFLADRLPAVERQFMVAYKQAWDYYVGGLSEAAEQALAESPFHIVAANIKSMLDSKDVRFDGLKVRSKGPVASTTARRTGDPIGGGMLAKPIGFHDDEHLYLSREVTFNWLAERLRRVNDDVAFSWNGFVKESIQQYDAKMMRLSGDLKNGRYLRVPIKNLLDT